MVKHSDICKMNICITELLTELNNLTRIYFAFLLNDKAMLSFYSI